MIIIFCEKLQLVGAQMKSHLIIKLQTGLFSKFECLNTIVLIEILLHYGWTTMIQCLFLFF